MAEQLSFDVRYEYDSRLVGITIYASLTYGDVNKTVYAKVDPGAEYCLFQREVADDLGIDLTSGDFRRFDTLAGSVDAYGHTVKLSTLGLEFESHVYFAAEYGLKRNLLGQNGWLRKMRVAIVDYDATIYLSLYDGST
ncbi:MAG: hypothetical protein HOP19_07145 [Acidobacteria bacterium]|nr:hypothetical protein [Acidobacteriota bacterium]